MRKIILGLVALAGVIAISDSAHARDRRYSSRSQRHSNGYTQQQVEYSQPQQQGYYNGQNDRPGFLGGLIEMEHRKNAWLRQTFFGR